MGDVGGAEVMLEGGSVLTQASIQWIGAKIGEYRKKSTAKRLDDTCWNQVALKLVEHATTVAQRFEFVCPVAFPQTRMAFSTIYVPLHVQASEGGAQFKIDAFPRGLFKDGSGRCLVLDAAGMGKTTIGRKVFLSALEDREAVPFFIDLRRMKGGQSLPSLIGMACGGMNDDELTILGEFLTTQRCLFIFDGFDEIEDSERASCDRQIRAFIDRCRGAKYLLTSRPDSDFSAFSDFARYRIRPLLREEAHDLIRKYGSYGGRPDLLIAELNNTDSEAVSSFLTNPLLTSLLFRAFEHKSVVPLKKSVFYHQVYDSLFESHDLNKEAGFSRSKKTKLHLDDMHRVLRAVAARFHARGVVEMTARDFKKAVDEARVTWVPDLSFAANDLLKDVTSAVPIFTRDGDYIRWTHKSLLDYFLAEFFANDFQGDKVEALKKLALSRHSFRNYNVISIIQEIDPILFNSECLIPALKEVIAEIDSIAEAHPSLPSSLRKFVSVFFGLYVVLVSRDDELHDIFEDDEKAKRFYESAGVDSEKYTPRMLTIRGRVGGMVILVHRHLLPIQVAMAGEYLKGRPKNPYAKYRSKNERFISGKSGEVVNMQTLLNASPAAIRRGLGDLLHAMPIAELPSRQLLADRYDKLMEELKTSEAMRRSYEF